MKMSRTLVLMIVSQCIAIQWQLHAQNVPTRSVRIVATSQIQFTRPPVTRSVPRNALMVIQPDSERLIMLDSSLTLKRVLLGQGAAPNQTFTWPPFPLSLIPFSKDSTIVADHAARTLLVLDESGRIDRSIAFPVSNEFDNLILQYAGHPGRDSRGKLIYARPPAKVRDSVDKSVRDTFRIVAGDFDERRADSLSWFSVPRRIVKASQLPDGRRFGSIYLDPFSYPADEWLITSDGAVAILRSDEYRLDWIVGGNVVSSTKLPYPWIRIDERALQNRVDSVKLVIDSLARVGKPYGMTVRYGALRNDTLVPTILFPKLSDIRSYIAPFRAGALQADRLGNVWILPLASEAPQDGVVYDVANGTKGLIERVRIPANCLVVGLGDADVVQLACMNNSTRIWTLNQAVVQRP